MPTILTRCGRKRLSDDHVGISTRLPTPLVDRIDRQADQEFYSRREMIETLLERGLSASAEAEG